MLHTAAVRRRSGGQHPSPERKNRSEIFRSVVSYEKTYWVTFVACLLPNSTFGGDDGDGDGAIVTHLPATRHFLVVRRRGGLQQQHHTTIDHHTRTVLYPRSKPTSNLKIWTAHIV